MLILSWFIEIFNYLTTEDVHLELFFGMTQLTRKELEFFYKLKNLYYQISTSSYDSQPID